MTGTESNKNQESRGQGIANFITGFFGGMAGCAMIGQYLINVKWRSREDITLIAGIFLMFLIIVLGGFVVQFAIPRFSRYYDYG